MRRSWLLGAAWATVLLMGTALAPAVLAVCVEISEAQWQAEPDAGAHCPMAEMAARALDCCVPTSAPGGEGDSPPDPTLPKCCFGAPEEPVDLPRAAGLHGESFAAAELPLRDTEELPLAVSPVSLPVDPALTAPPADLCILHAAFLN